MNAGYAESVPLYTDMVAQTSSASLPVPVPVPLPPSESLPGLPPTRYIGLM